MKSYTEKITDLNRERILRCLGYNNTKAPDAEIIDAINNLVERSDIRFRSAFSQVKISGLNDGYINTEKGIIRSRKFASISKRADTLFFCLATAETGEDKSSKSDIIESLIWDAMGTVAIEEAVTRLTETIKEVTGRNTSLPFSPGYCDFPLEGQKLIFSEFQDKPLGITFDKNSFMMSPLKSVSFIISASDTDMESNPCKLCNLKSCFMRRKI